MKFIHTADWHLGNTMLNIDRSRETAAFLEWLRGKIIETGAEALVIAGDVFDVPNPSNIARNQYYNFLASLRGSCCTNVVIVGGNHDSGSMLDAPAGALKFLNIHVVGTISNRKIDDLVLELKNTAGEVTAICCSVPFMRDLELIEFYRDKEDGATHDESHDDDLLRRLYADVYAQALELRGDKKIPIIATGHLYAANLEGRDSASGELSERIDDGVRDVVGSLGNVKVDVFPEGLDYVALGHIHYATKVAKNDKVRYSGSPFVMGFDEVSHKRSILMVDVNETLKVESIEVPQTSICYKQVKGTLDSIKQQLCDLEKELIQNPVDTYVDVLLTESDIVNLERALEDVESNKHFVVVRHRIERMTSAAVAPGMSGAESTKQFSKEEYFKRLVASTLNKDLDSEEVNKSYNEFLDLFHEAIEYAEHQQAREN